MAFFAALAVVALGSIWTQRAQHETPRSERSYVEPGLSISERTAGVLNGFAYVLVAANLRDAGAHIQGWAANVSGGDRVLRDAQYEWLAANRIDMADRLEERRRYLEQARDDRRREERRRLQETLQRDDDPLLPSILESEMAGVAIDIGYLDDVGFAIARTDALIRLGQFEQAANDLERFLSERERLLALGADVAAATLAVYAEARSLAGSSEVAVAAADEALVYVDAVLEQLSKRWEQASFNVDHVHMHNEAAIHLIAGRAYFARAISAPLVEGAEASAEFALARTAFERVEKIPGLQRFSRPYLDRIDQASR